MKLLTLELCDFRQFRGTQTIHFAAGKDRNVTILFGANGTGKTTILNAFTWALYGEFTPDLEHPERPVNDRVWEEASDGQELTAEVQLEFEHEGSRYTVNRRARGRKSPGAGQNVRGSEVSLHISDGSGRYTERNNPADALDQILPKRLHQFFFFNGERIERLAQHTAYEEIEQATKTLLGLEVMERAVRHLPKVAQKLEGELRKVGSVEQQELADRLKELRHQLERKQDEKAQARRNVAGIETRREAIARRLRELADARGWQEARDRCERDFRSNKERLKDQREAIDGYISDRGYLAFLDSLGSAVTARVGELKTRGELPTPIKRTFVSELLKAGECICGTHLTEGETAYQRVAAYRDKAGVADVEQRWVQLNGEAENIDRDRAQLRGDLERAVGLVSDLRAQQNALEERLSEVSRKLSDVPSEEIRELEKQHEKLLQEERDWLRREGGLEGEATRLNEQIKAEEDALRKAEAKSQEAAVAQRRAAVTSDAEGAFQRIYDLFQEEIRKELDGRIKETFGTISYKQREPELNEAFELRLWEVDSGSRMPAAKSTGENMILSLSFVGGLASLARDQERNANKGGGLEALLSGAGGTYPIVMDAAFGNLDEDYREDVARALPRLAPQSVILVSKAQAAGEVERELRTRIGRAYVISYHTAKEGEDEEITMTGRSYPYKVSTHAGDERAELNEMEVA